MRGREGHLETVMATVCKIAGVFLPEFTHCKGILQQCLHRKTTTQSHLSQSYTQTMKEGKEWPGYET